MKFTARVTSRAFEASRATSIPKSLRIAVLGLISVALSVLFVFPASLPAAAEPPLTVAEAKELIKQLQNDAAGIDQQYTGVKEQISQGQAQLKLKQADVQAQTDKVVRMKLQVGQVALAQFQNRNLDTAAHLFVSPDTDRFLSQISTVQNVAENQNSALQDYQQAQANLAAVEHAAETDLAALAERKKQLKSLADSSDKKLAEAERVLARLTAAQRQQIADERREQLRGRMQRVVLRRRGPPHAARSAAAARSQSAGVCESSARRALCPQWRRAELMGLLGADDGGLGIGRGEPAALLSAAVQPRPACRQGRSCAGRSGVLLQRHPPCGVVRRQRASHPCAAARKVGGVHQDVLYAICRGPPTRLSFRVLSSSRCQRHTASVGVLQYGDARPIQVDVDGFLQR